MFYNTDNLHVLILMVHTVAFIVAFIGKKTVGYSTFGALHGREELRKNRANPLFLQI